MKKAIVLIAATMVSTSVYSQSYDTSSSGSSAQAPDAAAQKEQIPNAPDYSSRQSESGAPASAEPSSSSSSSNTGYEKEPSLNGGNSSTGQSNGSNVNNTSNQDQGLTTRDSDVNGADYRGSANSGGSATAASESSASGSIQTDGALHVPASPVREGKKSEGWSSSGTFSGAGPGAVSGSSSSSATSPDATPGVSTQSNSKADVNSTAALENRDSDLRKRGLQPDSSDLVQEDWTIEPETNVGGPVAGESGSASNSDSVSRGASVNSDMDSGYSRDLYQRVQRDWSARLGADIPSTPGLMDRSLEELGRTRYSDNASNVGAPASSERGSAHRETDLDGSVRSSGSIDHDSTLSDKYHFNQGTDKKAQTNRSAGEDQSANSTAPSDYGDRSNDDGHLNGNNSASGTSGSSESGTSSSEESSGSVKQPDL